MWFVYALLYTDKVGYIYMRINIIISGDHTTVQEQSAKLADFPTSNANNDKLYHFAPWMS